LRAQGIPVVAAPIPLTSLSDDVKALDRVLTRLEGPVVLVGHAYSGAVISATRHERVSALAYVAGLTPAHGETVFEVFTREKPHALAPRIAPEADGFIWLPEDAFPAAFAQNATPDQLAVLAATQRPIALPAIQESSPQPLWTRKPSWYLVCEQDRMIPHAGQKFMAGRMGAKIRTARVDHVPMITAPEPVLALIQDALEQRH
jgi:pimeloyl-ACP methyl ester carboxylesterase